MKTNQKKAMAALPHQKQVSSNMGQTLRSYRLAARLTQDTAAERAGVSRQTISRIEKGDPSVSVGQILRLADAVKALPLFAFQQSEQAAPGARRVRRTMSELALQAAA